MVVPWGWRECGEGWSEDGKEVAAAWASLETFLRVCRHPWPDSFRNSLGPSSGLRAFGALDGFGVGARVGGPPFDPLVALGALRAWGANSALSRRSSEASSSHCRDFFSNLDGRFWAKLRHC